MKSYGGQCFLKKKIKIKKKTFSADIALLLKFVFGHWRILSEAQRQKLTCNRMMVILPVLNN